MACAIDLLRGEITDDKLRALACLLEDQGVFAVVYVSIDLSGPTLVVDYQRNIDSVVISSTGVVFVNLAKPLPGLNQGGIAGSVSAKGILNPPFGWTANFASDSQIVLRLYDNTNTLAWPDKFSISVLR